VSRRDWKNGSDGAEVTRCDKLFERRAAKIGTRSSATAEKQRVSSKDRKNPVAANIRHPSAANDSLGEQVGAHTSKH